MKYNNLILIIFGMLFFYILFIKKEGMSNSAIDNRIKAIYQADINSIRNLSKLANDLINNGKLVVPGGLQIKGSLSVDGDAFLNKNSQIKGTLGVYGKTTFHNEGEFKKTSRFHGITYFKNQKKNIWSHMNWSDGNVYLRGNIIIDGAGGTGKSLKTGSLNTGSLKINRHNFTSSGSLYLTKDGSSRNIVFHHSNHTSIGLQNTKGSRKWVYN